MNFSAFSTVAKDAISIMVIINIIVFIKTFFHITYILRDTRNCLKRDG